MKLEELMMDDWVLQDDGTPIKIRLRDLCRIDCGQLFVEPIPITKGMLEANGFELSICCEFYRHKSNKNLKFNLLGDVLIICFGKLKIIHYVHELQHALRLCGLNDLADNFKLN